MELLDSEDSHTGYLGWPRKSDQSRFWELIYNKVLPKDVLAIDKEAVDILDQGPSITQSSSKPHPSWPYGIGRVPQETEYPDLGGVGKSLSEENLVDGLPWFFCKGHDIPGLAFSTFFGNNLNLGDVGLLSNYTHLRYIYLARNVLLDMRPFCALSNLLLLDMTENLLTAEEYQIPVLQTLEVLSLMKNRICRLDDFPWNRYRYLNLSYNQLESLTELTSDKFTYLETLELRGNRLKSLGKLHLPLLKHLWVAENELTSMAPLIGCPKLVSFHARGNLFEDFSDFPYGLKNLQYINLRNNKILWIASVRYLGKAPIKALILAENTCCEVVANYRIETLAFLTSLIRLDKYPITTCELEAARFIKNARINRTIPPLSKHQKSMTPPPTPQEDCVPLFEAQKDKDLWSKIMNPNTVLSPKQPDPIQTPEQSIKDETETMEFAGEEGAPVTYVPTKRESHGSKIVRTIK